MKHNRLEGGRNDCNFVAKTPVTFALPFSTPFPFPPPMLQLNRPPLVAGKLVPTAPRLPPSTPARLLVAPVKVPGSKVVPTKKVVPPGAVAAPPGKVGDKPRLPGPRIKAGEYQQLSDLEHVLARPNTYIGSTSRQRDSWFLYSHATKRMVLEEDQEYVPALLKIFDEILVNAADNRQRDPNTNTLRVRVDVEKTLISVMNNGQAIPVVLHDTEDVYIPEFVLGLRASSNFGDRSESTTGGLNGLGASLCVIFSLFFQVEVVDAVRKLHYVQHWTKNMKERHPPVIKPILPGTELDKRGSSTKMTFRPDLARLGNLKSLAETSTLRMMERRVRDLGAVCNLFPGGDKAKKQISPFWVFWNDEMVSTDSFEEYAQLFPEPVVFKVPSKKNADDGEESGDSDSDAMSDEEGGAGAKDDDESGGEEEEEIDDNHMSDSGDDVATTAPITTKSKKQSASSAAVHKRRLQLRKEMEARLRTKGKGGKKKTKSAGSGRGNSLPYLYLKLNSQWEVLIGMQSFSRGGQDERTKSISYVNSIYTPLGGTHVDFIRKQVADYVVEYIKKKHKDVRIQRPMVLNHLFFVVNCLVTNSDFDNQTKNKLLKTLSKEEEVLATLPPAFLEKLVKRTNLVGEITFFSKFMDDKNATAKLNGKKQRRLTGIKGLVDANDAGGKNSRFCTMILTEGASADQLVAGGICLLGPDRYGRFPMKGKGLNVDQLARSVVLHNKEIGHIIKIIGLKFDKVYTSENISELRYGQVMIMTDQDSVSSNSPLTLRDDSSGLVFVECIEDLVKEWHTDIHGRHYGEMPSPHSVWTEAGWTRISRVMRHWVTKPLFRVTTINGSSIDVSSDHSLLLADGETVAPADCQTSTTELLTSLPPSSDLCNLHFDVEKAFRWGQNHRRVRCDGELGPLILNASPAAKLAFLDGYGWSPLQLDIHCESAKAAQTWVLFFTSMLEGQDDKRPVVERLADDTFVVHPLVRVSSSTAPVGLVHSVEQLKEKEEEEPSSRKVGRWMYDLETSNHHFQAGVGSLVVHNTDGSHIKGLLMKFFTRFWPSLLSIPNHPFLWEFITPLLIASRSLRSAAAFRATSAGNVALPSVAIPVHATPTMAVQRPRTAVAMPPSTVTTPWLTVQTKNQERVLFYSKNDYDRWLETPHGKSAGWGKKPKYYKGLGTSTTQEMIIYCKNLQRHKHFFTPLTDNDETMIDTAFGKSPDNLQSRKRWLKRSTYDVFEGVDFSRPCMSYADFMNCAVRQFAYDATLRAIPCAIDALKPGQRKILYVCFLRNLVHKEIKVAQLSGSVAERSGYHHNEKSIETTSVKMAHTHVGSNNINTLQPIGQFGTRINGGKAAAGRYLFTLLEPIARLIYRPEDDKILHYLIDDGMQVEPQYYVPILPMVLVNGTKGLGVGWSTSIPNFNPRDLIVRLYHLLAEEDEGTTGQQELNLDTSTAADLTNPIDVAEVAAQVAHESEPSVPAHEYEGDLSTIAVAPAADLPVDMSSDVLPLEPLAKHPRAQGLIDQLGSLAPWYRGFTGTWTRLGPQNFLQTGIIEQTSPITFRITDLPAGVWTDKQKVLLEKMLIKEKIEEFKEYHTDTKVRFDIEMLPEQVEKVVQSGKTWTQFFGLEKKVSLRNMVLFDKDGRLRKFDTPEDILYYVYQERLRLYQVRKEFMIKTLESEIRILKNRVRYIRAVRADDIKLKGSTASVIEALVKGKYTLQKDLKQNEFVIGAQDEEEEDDSDHGERPPPPSQTAAPKGPVPKITSPPLVTTEDNVLIRIVGAETAELLSKKRKRDGQAESLSASIATATWQDPVTKRIYRTTDFGYLLHMSQVSLTLEQAKYLERQCQHAQEQIDVLRTLSIIEMYRSELVRFEKALGVFEKEWDEKFHTATLTIEKHPAKGKK